MRARERIEAGLLEVLELLVEAAYSRNKEAPLRRAALSPQPSSHGVGPRRNEPTPF